MRYFIICMNGITSGLFCIINLFQLSDGILFAPPVLSAQINAPGKEFLR